MPRGTHIQPDVIARLVAGGTHRDRAAAVTVAGELRLLPRAAEPLVTFVLDDANTSDAPVLPIFSARGVAGTTAVILNGMTGSGTITNGGPGPFLSATTLRDWQTAGWEIAGHTVSHLAMGAATTATMDAEMLVARNGLQDAGFTVRNHVWVGGSNSVASRRYAARHFRSAVAASGGSNVAQGSFDHYRILRVDLNAQTLVQAKASVDTAQANGQWLVFMVHTHFANWTTNAWNTNLATLLDYIIAKPVPIVTLDAGLDRWGNRLQFGDPSAGAVRLDATGLPAFQTPDTIEYLNTDLGYSSVPRNVSLYGGSASSKTANATVDGMHVFFKTGGHYGCLTFGQGRMYSVYGDSTGFQFARRTYIADATLDYTMPATSIPAQGTVDFDTGTFVNNVTGDVVVANPKVNMEAGLIWQGYCNAASKFAIRVANVTAAPISMASRGWRLIGKLGSLT